MACIRNAQTAVWRKICAEAGGETANHTVAKSKVQCLKHRGRREIVAAVRGAKQKGGGQSGCDTFAADVADHHPLTSVLQDAAAVEVSSHFAGGQECNAEGHAGRDIQLFRHERALHLAGGGEFAVKLRVLVRGRTLILKDVADQCHHNDHDRDGPVRLHRSRPGLTPKDDLAQIEGGFEQRPEGTDRGHNPHAAPQFGPGPEGHELSRAGKCEDGPHGVEAGHLYEQRERQRPMRRQQDCGDGADV